MRRELNVKVLWNGEKILSWIGGGKSISELAGKVS